MGIRLHGALLSQKRGVRLLIILSRTGSGSGPESVSDPDPAPDPEI